MVDALVFLGWRHAYNKQAWGQNAVAEAFVEEVDILPLDLHGHLVGDSGLGGIRLHQLSGWFERHGGEASRSPLPA